MPPERLWSSSPTVFTPTPAVAALQRYVGASTVGLGPNPSFSCTGLGIQPDANVAFGLHELAVYDPMVPENSFISFEDAYGKSAGDETVNEYCPHAYPDIGSSALRCRLHSRVSGNTGAEGLSLRGSTGNGEPLPCPPVVPGNADPVACPWALPSNGAVGTPLAVTRTDSFHWHMVADSATPQVLGYDCPMCRAGMHFLTTNHSPSRTLPERCCKPAYLLDGTRSSSTTGRRRSQRGLRSVPAASPGFWRPSWLTQFAAAAGRSRRSTSALRDFRVSIEEDVWAGLQAVLLDEAR